MDQCFGPSTTGTRQQTGQEIFPAGTYSFRVFYNDTDFRDSFGWYPADDPSQLNEMIPNNVGASISLDIPVDFGLYLDVIPPADWHTGPYTLRSQEELNPFPEEFVDNLITFDVPNNATVVAVEDIEPFPDYDFNDAVMLMVPGDSIPALPDCSSDSRFDEIWTREFGTEVDEGELDIATHSTGVYVSGYTLGSFPGFTNAGDADAFIKKFDVDGNELWTVQFGTSEGDGASSIAVDDSGVYAIGRGIGIQKFDHDGNHVWSAQIDGANVNDVAADGSGVYVVGDTGIELAGSTKTGPDEWTIGPMFLRKYEPATGNVLYTVQWGVGPAVFGEEPETIDAVEFGALPTATNVDVFSGAVYVAGRGWPEEIRNNWHPWYEDAHVDKLNADDGTFMWSTFLNQPFAPGAADVDAGPQGIFFAGTCCVSPGAAGPSGTGYLAKLDEDGNWVFLHKFTQYFLKVSGASGPAVDDTGVYVTGAIASGPDYLQQRFLKKFDFDGKELASSEVSMFTGKVATDSSGVYVVGTIAESFPEFVETEQVDVRLDKYAVSPITEANLTVNTVDLAGMPFTGGLWTVIRSSNGTILEKGFTPLEFQGTAGATYKVTVSDFDDKTFDHWQDDGSTQRTRIVTLASDTELTAVYDIGDALRGFAPLTYTGTEEQPDLTVNAVTLDGETLHMWTIIDPQSTNSSRTTYKVYAGDYQDKVFDHWEDGSTDRVKTLTIAEDTTITAYYQVMPP